MNRLHQGFIAGERVQALNGFGGIGKTQTAIEYAYCYREDYKFVLWGSAHSRDTLVSDFAAMATVLDLPEKNAQDQSEAVRAVKRWLENNDGWLLILDNADELAMAREFIPSRETGHVLLTTRAQNTRPIAARQAVEKMEPREGTLFLLHRLEKLKKDEPLESAPEGLRKQAEALSKAVDGLPLALDQAAAFIEEKPSTLEEYQTLYQSERKELLKRRGKLADDHRDSVSATFSLAFKTVADANPAAADLLRLCAFLEADAIPEEIFSEGAKDLGEALGPVAESSLGLSDAIEEAGRFLLLQRNPGARTVSLHRLVQAVLKDEMDDDARRMWVERAVRAVNSAFPNVEYSKWQLCSRLVPHAQSLARLVDEFDFDFPETARMINQAGEYLYERAQFAEAEPLNQRALIIREKSLGPEHPDVATSLNNLAMLYNDQDKFVEAEPLVKRALTIREKAFGPEHSDVATSLNNLALLYHTQGRFAEAEPLYQRALAISEKSLGAEHPSVADTINNLAFLYYDQGKYAEAEPLFLHTLALRDKALGAEHPDVITSLNGLVWLYEKLGKYVEAELFMRRSLATYERAYGAEHPWVANTLNKLADLYRSQGKYAEAESLYQRVLALREKAIGTEHLDVAAVLEDYAALLCQMKREDEAAELETRAKSIRAKRVWRNDNSGR